MKGRKEKATQKWPCRKGPSQAHPRSGLLSLKGAVRRAGLQGSSGDESQASAGGPTHQGWDDL